MKIPAIVGIVNGTPDSFSDGGAYDPVSHALRLADEGAAMLDIGGESTRPGALAVDESEEKARVIPVIRTILRLRPGTQISVDTRRASTAAAALELGAVMVNDVSAGRDPDMFTLCGKAGATMVLMHMRGSPTTMRDLAIYDDVCAEVWSELAERAQAATKAGIHRIVLDPGLGFAKSPAQNFAILRDLPNRRQHTVMVGASRKSFIGETTGQAVAADRVEGSIAVALHCMESGVGWVRVHDVASTRRAFAVRAAIAGTMP